VAANNAATLPSAQRFLLGLERIRRGSSQETRLAVGESIAVIRKVRSIVAAMQPDAGRL
jgi:hypothetical protein